MCYRIVSKGLLLALLCGCGASALGKAVLGDEVPGWLKQAALTTPPVYDKKVPAVVLVDEGRTTVEEDGRMLTASQYAVRILAREGRGEAVAMTVYRTDTDKVKEMRAWLIRPSGEVVFYGKKEAVDLSVVNNDVYNDLRKRVISAVDAAEPGATFGYEIVTEDRSVFSQSVWYFQHDLPVRSSRFTLVLPPNWKASGITFNAPKLEPAVNGTTYVWEMRDLAPIPHEPAAPEMSNLAPRLAVSLYPPPGKAAQLRTFTSWQDVARYDAELSDPQAIYNDAMSAKAHELTAGAKNEWEIIQAIGRYAQNVNYISIQTNLGRGGGYKPHAATDVFAKNYGDCKDKANLMRALLKAVKIESYPVSIFAGDPTFVRAEWPSPRQFNHAIIAVRVSDATDAPTVIKHPQLGRLLIFDPTDEHTPVGDLPQHEQGSFALIGASEHGELLRMPVTAPEANKLERTISAELSAEGSLTATVQERFTGQAAVTSRREVKRMPPAQYHTMIERWVTQTAPAAAIAKVAPQDDPAANRFALDVEFKSPAYAQVMRGRLMVFKPAIVGRRDLTFPTEMKRTHPVVLDAEAYSETVTIKLPAGFEVDELPDAAELNQPFGNYAAKFEVKGDQLIFRRTLVLKSATVPVEQYSAVRSFFERIRAVEQAPVVLAKK